MAGQSHAYLSFPPPKPTVIIVGDKEKGRGENSGQEISKSFEKEKAEEDHPLI